jgi:bacillithiol biosynthesis cysteine-adding enzyme BshC
MLPACIRHTDLPGTSKLFADFSYHFDKVAKFYRHDPHEPGSFAAAAAEVDYPADRRASLVDALRRQNPSGSAALARLAEPGTLAVVTGQQVGLFGGPAYTIYKALTAARLARTLSDRGIPAVPIFWLASEDHDFKEISLAWSFDSSLHPVRLDVEAPSDVRDRPVPAGPVRPEAFPIPALAESLKGFPHADQVIAEVEQAYRPGTSMAEGFRALIEKILAPLGLLFLDPLDPAIRRICAPFMSEALRATPDLKAALIERGSELTAAGYHAQVLVDPKTSLFFLLENGERVPLRLKDSEFVSLCDRAADVSPNALLRPVMQDYLLPTVAYVGGPGELAYFAQSEVIYKRLLGRMPVMFSRAGFTILDARAERLLARYKLSVPEALVPENALRDRVAHALVPPELEQSLDAATSEVERQVGTLSGQLEQFDPTLTAALSKSQAKIRHQMQKIRLKTAREILRRDREAASGSDHLHQLLFPHRHMQERFYSILPFLAKYGFDLPQHIYEALELSCPDHRIITF